MGWEFPLSSLISLDMVDMVKRKVVFSGDAPFLHRSIYVPLRSYDCDWSRALGLGRGLVCSAAVGRGLWAVAGYFSAGWTPIAGIGAGAGSLFFFLEGQMSSPRGCLVGCGFVRAGDVLLLGELFRDIVG